MLYKKILNQKDMIIMMNKKMLGIIIAAIVTVTSVVPAFAAEKAPRDPSDKAVKIEAKQEKHAAKAERQAEKLAKLQEKAAKLGINIDGRAFEEAKTKLEEANQEKLQAKPEKLGLDITGLSREEVKAKIKAAVTEKKEVKTDENTSAGTEQ